MFFIKMELSKFDMFFCSVLSIIKSKSKFSFCARYQKLILFVLFWRWYYEKAAVSLTWSVDTSTFLGKTDVSYLPFKTLHVNDEIKIKFANIIFFQPHGFSCNNTKDLQSSGGARTSSCSWRKRANVTSGRDSVCPMSIKLEVPGRIIGFSEPVCDSHIHVYQRNTKRILFPPP